DRLRRDARPFDELLGLARARDLADAEHPGRQAERRHRLAEAARLLVILDSDQLLRLGRGLAERRLVDRLYAVGVDDADRDALFHEEVVGLEGFVEGDARGHDGRGVLRRALERLGAADGELVLRGVESLALGA